MWQTRPELTRALSASVHHATIEKLGPPDCTTRQHTVVRITGQRNLFLFSTKDVRIVCLQPV